MGQGIELPPAFQRPSGKLYLANNQLNLVSTVCTLVDLDTIPADFTDGIENTGTHRITPGYGGFYAITGQVTFEAVVADKDYEARVRLNGGGYICRNVSHASKAGSLSVPVSLSCQLMTVADYIELWAQSDAGVDTVDINISEVFTFLALQRVR